ncbi:hypothetical protein D3C74_474040 [compost metagenome]
MIVFATISATRRTQRGKYTFVSSAVLEVREFIPDMMDPERYPQAMTPMAIHTAKEVIPEFVPGATPPRITSPNTSE